MQKKFFGIALPAFIVAAAFMFGMSFARVQQVRAAVAPTQSGLVAAPAAAAAAAGGVPCLYCRQMYMQYGDYYWYMNCLYSPPCTN